MDISKKKVGKDKKNISKLGEYSLLFQLTYMIYGQEPLDLNSTIQIITNMPLPPVCCYDGIGKEPQEPNNIQKVLNEKYKAIIERYAKQIKLIYKENKGIINDKVIDKFKEKEKDLLERLVAKNKFVKHNGQAFIDLYK